jgi:hypothetical protein
MADDGFLSAKASWIDGKPGKLALSGTVLAFTPDATVSFRESDSPPLNPTILGIQLEVAEGSGPKKGTAFPWECGLEMATLDPYKQVQVSGGDETVIVDIHR